MIITRKPEKENPARYFRLRIFLYATFLAAILVCYFFYGLFQKYRTKHLNISSSKNTPKLSKVSIDRGEQARLSTGNSSGTCGTMRADRDPFMPLYEGKHESFSGDGNFYIRAIPDEDNKPTVPDTINMSLTGIVRGMKGYNAIIKDRSGRSHIVSPGEEIRGWRVSFITERNVFLLKWNNVTILELEDTKRKKDKKSTNIIKTITL